MIFFPLFFYHHYVVMEIKSANATKTAVKRDASDQLVEGEVRLKKEKRTVDSDLECISWDVDLNPNVTEITMIQDAPLKLILLARPSGQGKHNPILCFATEQVLINLDTLEKQSKTEQQKRRRILKKMSNALIKYSASNTLPARLKSVLKKTIWGAEIIGKLQFEI